MKLKTRVLIQTLSASLAFTLLLGGLFFLSTAGIRNTALDNSDSLGNSAAELSFYALEEQVTDKIARIAQDVALVLNGKIEMIENHTLTTADIAGTIYTRREAYRPQPLRRVFPGELSPPEPYLHAAPGVDLARIRGETDLAGNVGDLLRQITVIDRGIATSTIGGESGYIIAMDAFPWPSVDFDYRLTPWYRGAREKGGLYWTGVYGDLRDRGPAVSCAVPFYDRSGGRRILRGVARSTVMLSGFSAIIDSAKVGRTGYLFILDQSGLRLFSSGSVDVKSGEDGSIRGANYLESPNPRLRSLGLSMTLGASGMTELEIEGVPVYVAYAPVSALGWSLGVAIPVQEVSAPAWIIEEQIRTLTDTTRRGMDRQILLLGGLSGIMLIFSLAAVAFLSVRFASALTAPIVALNEGVREVSGGNLDREVRISTGDELEQLAASFNDMTGRLKEHIAESSRAAAEKERIATELDVAARIQISMLPRDFPPFPGRENSFGLYAMVSPAREVGGDFYDFFFIDDSRFAVVIADVSGKGVPAALFMAIAKTLIRNHLQGGEEPEWAMENINRQLCRGNSENMFVTLWLGILEIATGCFSYINAGHNPPLLKTGGKDFVFLVSPPDLVLAGMEDTLYHHREIVLETGDTLFLYTDGVTEAVDPGGLFYGEERLRRFLDSQGELPPRELLAALCGDIGDFSGGAEQFDDITMLALRIGETRKEKIITLRADTEQLEKLTGFIGEKLEKAGCPERIRGQIELAAEEVFVNIASYAYRARTGEVRVSCGTEVENGETVMTLEFADRGEPFNPLDHPDPDLNVPLEERTAGGLGLLIVKRTMDTIQYSYDEDGINRLRIKKSWQGFHTLPSRKDHDHTSRTERKIIGGDAAFGPS
ncbi:MAG: SpoIIE family protein phosphatase [Treponema sp.]|jgi:sigma-B regulation protein RsbU (phosphoserine phosphatase)|nr:SpoIIE family protein phosphatase [Treponema sp.]